MADAKEIAALLVQKIGDDLKMQMRRPAAVFGPVAQMRNDLPGRDLGPRLAKCGQASPQMPIERVEGSRLGHMVKDQRMPVIQRIGIVDD